LNLAILKLFVFLLNNTIWKYRQALPARHAAAIITLPASNFSSSFVNIERNMPTMRLMRVEASLTHKQACLQLRLAILQFICKYSLSLREHKDK